jgi:selenocysteine lyase/cysteine desulfurase
MTSEFLTSIEKIEKLLIASEQLIIDNHTNLKLAWAELKNLKELTAYPIQPNPEQTDYFKGMGLRTRAAIIEIKEKFGVEKEIDRHDQFVVDTIYKHRVTNFGKVLSFIQNRGFVEVNKANNKNGHILSFKFKNI